jgi:hypothetical protein
LAMECPKTAPSLARMTATAVSSQLLSMPSTYEGVAAPPFAACLPLVEAWQLDVLLSCRALEMQWLWADVWPAVGVGVLPPKSSRINSTIKRCMSDFEKYIWLEPTIKCKATKFLTFTTVGCRDGSQVLQAGCKQSQGLPTSCSLHDPLHWESWECKRTHWRCEADSQSSRRFLHAEEIKKPKP